MAGEEDYGRGDGGVAAGGSVDGRRRRRRPARRPARRKQGSSGETGTANEEVALQGPGPQGQQNKEDQAGMNWQQQLLLGTAPEPAARRGRGKKGPNRHGKSKSEPQDSTVVTEPARQIMTEDPPLQASDQWLSQDFAKTHISLPSSHNEVPPGPVANINSTSVIGQGTEQHPSGPGLWTVPPENPFIGEIGTAFVPADMSSEAAAKGPPALVSLNNLELEEAAADLSLPASAIPLTPADGLWVSHEVKGMHSRAIPASDPSPELAGDVSEKGRLQAFDQIQQDKPAGEEPAGEPVEATDAAVTSDKAANSDGAENADSLTAKTKKEEAFLTNRNEGVTARAQQCKYVRNPDIAKEIITGGINPSAIGLLEKGIREVYEKIVPPENDTNRRASLVRHLQKVCRKEWPHSKVILFGSSGTGLELKNGDVDVCAIVPPEDARSNKDGNIQTTRNLVWKASRLLRRARMQDIEVRGRARVPIVQFFDPVSGYKVDMCVNNELARHNTELIATYVSLDWRVKPLVLALKYWAKCRRINEAYRGTLSSYAYALLMIHFLVRRPKPVLPCLQQSYQSRPVRDPSNVQRRIEEGWNVYFDREFKWLKDPDPNENKESVGELLLSFFWYHAFIHNYETMVFCPRTGGFLSREGKSWDYVEENGVFVPVPAKPEDKEVAEEESTAETSEKTKNEGRTRNWRSDHRFSIEDPFDLSHDLGKAVTQYSLDLLIDEFIRAIAIIRSGGTFQDICEEYIPSEDELDGDDFEMRMTRKVEEKQAQEDTPADETGVAPEDSEVPV
ncbi:hypothetical protein NDN08_007988 [Rhodosorus marinus]|uniref:Poly(A) RNA polymerase mitochondrial-like central palm domain-containing protein n=1 Tax=Rhodosorus marinus TaxID=101924 RepID=A0AAV8V0A3_9RHOD|nr:hypothetical protein NDN08_007988 [Rhodosorus marinus]